MFKNKRKKEEKEKKQVQNREERLKLILFNNTKELRRKLYWNKEKQWRKIRKTITLIYCKYLFCYCLFQQHFTDDVSWIINNVTLLKNSRIPFPSGICSRLTVTSPWQRATSSASRLDARAKGGKIIFKKFNYNVLSLKGIPNETNEKKLFKDNSISEANGLLLPPRR